MPLGPAVSCELLPGETGARLLAANESEEDWALLVHLVTAATAVRSVSGLGQGGVGESVPWNRLGRPFFYTSWLL